MKIGEPPADVYAQWASHSHRRVEKASAASALSRRVTAAAPASMVIAGAERACDLYRSETAEFELRPEIGPACGFMAQWISQIMEITADNTVHAARIYAESAIAPDRRAAHFIRSA